MKKKRKTNKFLIIIISFLVLLSNLELGIFARAETLNGSETSNEEVNFLSNGGEYAIDYIFRNYNVFSFGDIGAIHINGAVIAGGDVYKIDSIDKDNLEIYKSNDRLQIADDISNIDTINYKLSNPIYIKGNANISNPTHHHKNKIYFGNNSEVFLGGNKVEEGLQRTDNYINWEHAKNKFNEEAKSIYDNASRTIKASDIKEYKELSSTYKYAMVRPGENVVISEEAHDKIDYILFESKSMFDTELTKITYVKDGEVKFMPFRYANSEDLEHNRFIETGFVPGGSYTSDKNVRGINIINSYPNAKRIKIKDSEDQHSYLTGQLLAPDTDVYFLGGNSNSNMIVKNLYSRSENHFWPLSYEEVDKVAETTEVNVVKKWLGKVEESVEVELLSNGKVVDQVELKKENEWKHSFINLPKYDDNEKLIDYTVQEVSGDKYNVSIKKDGNTFTLTNENYGERNIVVEKSWLGKVEDSVEIQLLADGQLQETVKLSSTNKWKHEFKSLKKYDDNGSEINYTVDEVDGDKYNYEIVKHSDEHYEIINTNHETTEVNVVKKWLGKVEESVEVELLSNGKVVDQVELKKENEWKHSFINLPKYDDNEKLIDYTVQEVSGDKYNVSIKKDGNTFTLTNENYGERNIVVEKSWLGKVEDSVEIQLLADGQLQETVKLSSSNKWKHEFKSLKKYDDNGSEINYTVDEVDGEKYNYEIVKHSDDHYEIINTNHETTEVNVVKKWLGKVEESVEVELLSNGKVVDQVELKKENEWKHSFINLPKYDDNEKLIDYTVQEVSGDKYNVSIKKDGNTFTLTNENYGKRTIEIQKNWIGKKLDFVKVQVYSNQVLLQTVTLNESNNWKISIDNLRIYDDNGDVIVYTIHEIKPYGYSNITKGDMDEGFVITNIEEDSVLTENDTPIINDQDDLSTQQLEPNLPKTGMGGINGNYLGLPLIIIGYLAKRKQEK